MIGPLPPDSYRPVRLQAVLGRNCRVFAPRWRTKAIAKARVQCLGGLLIHVDIDAPAFADHEGAKIVNAMRVVGMLVRVQNPVEPVHLSGEQLLAQVRGGVDQRSRDTRRP